MPPCQRSHIPFRWAESTAVSIDSGSVALVTSAVGFVFDRVVRVVGGVVVFNVFFPFDLFPLVMVEGQRGADFRFPPTLVGFLCPPSLLTSGPEQSFSRIFPDFIGPPRQQCLRLTHAQDVLASLPQGVSQTTFDFPVIPAVPLPGNAFGHPIPAHQTGNPLTLPQ